MYIRAKFATFTCFAFEHAGFYNVFSVTNATTRMSAAQTRETCEKKTTNSTKQVIQHLQWIYVVQLVRHVGYTHFSLTWPGTGINILYTLTHAHITHDAAQ